MKAAWDRAAAAHVLRRVGFGANTSGLRAVHAQGLQATVQELLSKDAVDPILDKGLPGVLATESIDSLASWWMARLLGDGAPFKERLALVWHNHFATSHSKVRDARLMHAQIQLFRKHGAGDFRVLLRIVAQDPAMLLWLDGNDNRLGQPNENFAREVLELFALGLGAYNEGDVQEVARAFTGLGVDRRQFVFRKRHHDGGEKTIFGTKGAFGGEQVLDLILAHPACPRWIARRLLVEFAMPDPSADEIETWSQILLQEDWHVGRTLERLFLSDLFLSPRARRSRIAGPVELVVGTCLSLEVAPAPKLAVRAASDMGQQLYRPPSVKGWEGGRTWIHAGTWMARHNALVELAHLADQDKLNWNPTTGFDHLFPDGASEALKSQALSTGNFADALTLILTTPESQLV